VYGLKDGDADLWDESQICYNNAPGFSASPMGQYVLNPDATENLGTVLLDGLGLKTSSISNLNLDSFLHQDTNGLLTLILVCDSGDPGDDWKMTTKESDPLQAPKLTLPHADGQIPLEVTTAQGRGADTYLSNDNQYNSTGPDGKHGSEGVIKIRDYSRDQVLIANTPTISFEEKGLMKSQVLSSSSVDISDYSVIGIRAIGGITFDLQRIRSYYPNRVSLKSFTAVCGLVETLSKSPKAGFYVLVDGQERFSKLNMAPGDQPCTIEVKLTDQDAYLTLVAADGTDRKSSRDWCYFADPRLNIE
jgi:hypothetical protein